MDDKQRVSFFQLVCPAIPWECLFDKINCYTVGNFTKKEQGECELKFVCNFW